MQDVDAILPLSWLAAEDENMNFWRPKRKQMSEFAAPAQVIHSCQ